MQLVCVCVWMCGCVCVCVVVCVCVDACVWMRVCCVCVGEGGGIGQGVTRGAKGMWDIYAHGRQRIGS